MVELKLVRLFEIECNLKTVVYQADIRRYERRKSVECEI